MYTKDEAKQIREEFWHQFRNWSARLRSRKGKKGKWLMNDTGIKQLRLKFHFDEKKAFTGIEIDTRNLDKRITLWEKLVSLRTVLEQDSGFALLWEIEYPLHTGKTVSRVYAEMKSVNIYQRDTWKTVNDFFYRTMTVFEDFFLEYRDYLKYQ